MSGIFSNKLISCVFFFLLISASVYSQRPISIETTYSCSYTGEPVVDDLYEFSSSSEANRVINRIMNTIGLKPRFEIMAANVPNAAAVIYHNKRYILYSQNFISQIDNATRTDWAAISILAHEIAHHLNGHTLESGGSRPSHELEADEFSGFVLRKMGATITQAQAAMRILADEEGSDTHPPKSARLEAIAVGWQQADEENPSEVLAQRENHENSGDVWIKEPAPKIERIQTEASLPVERKYLVGKVIFDNKPDKEYYLTTQLNLISQEAEKVVIVGKLTKSNVSDYPYMIYNQNNNYVYVAKDGIIYNSDQEKVGQAVNL